MPYYFEKPVWMGLIKMSAKYDRDPQVLVRQIMMERLVQEGFLKKREDCLHDRHYKGKRYVICWDCGTALGETEEDAEVKIRLDRQAREREAKLCQWNDERSHDFTAEDPIRCKRCGVTYDEFYANYEKRRKELQGGEKNHE